MRYATIADTGRSGKGCIMDQSRKPMPAGLRVSSWIIAILTIVACYVPLVLFGIGAFAEGAIDSSFESIINTSLAIVPALQIVNLTLGIIVAARKDTDALSVARAIMLTFKLALIPFFLLGGAIEALCLIGGFHPILVGFMWFIGLGLAVFGWFAVLPGSIWTIATAVKAKQSALISSGECALYIVLSLFFVADVVGSIVLFVRAGSHRAFYG